ncbi:hypothetical protein CK203_089280 [Vitis vinifera]|uniref:Uncharacterized protein n=1 Tax=Vitis vinifera TaxID=29760 RepID=A0A438BSW3_VITVI|nr:hypothetical protein CK203_089280 [Vitis vinifera]
MAFYRVSPFRYGSLSSLIPYVSSPSSLSPPVRTFTLSASISTPHPSPPSLLTASPKASDRWRPMCLYYTQVDMMVGFYLVEDINVVERLQETEFSFVKLRFGFLCGIGHPFRECVFEIDLTDYYPIRIAIGRLLDKRRPSIWASARHSST